ncbi:smad nuclear-interacting protein 1-like [Antedon mediterranea]|uniref:smad nuclear-interacting protein 1-like n=1 Tax=Antedon mediterranea TaxID=105859 RepID=UPI003AF616E7
MSSKSHHRDSSPHHRHKHHKKHKKRSSPSRHRRSRSQSPEESHDHHRPRKHKMRHHDEERHGRHREYSTSPRRREREHHDNRNTQTENRRGHRHEERSHQPPVRIKQEREENDDRRRRDHKNKPTNPFQTSENNEYGQPNDANQMEEPAQPKQGPDFGLSGKLAEETNTFRGIVIKYNEPPEARKPKKKWRLYVFKGAEQMPVLQVHRQSAYLLGRDRMVADIPIDHPSCSKQHAALQFRLVNYQRDDGTTGRRVKPFVIDLNSSNGTVVNNVKVEPQRYVELFEKDVVKFGYSSREYVLLHEKTSVDESDEEDV